MLVVSAASLVAVLVLVCVPRAGGVGFQARLYTPPSFISLFEEPDNRLSVARPPKSYPILSHRGRAKPKVIRSSFADNSISFNTEYFTRRGMEREMIPVSVDADLYSTYRRRKHLDEKLESELQKNISDPNRQQQSKGLGISVGLPKRLEHMFGEGGAGLTVTGYRRISFSGRSQWTDGATNDAYTRSKFPSLQMEQISRFDITGTIGTKISVKVSQDSQTDIPLSNRIQIRYKGDEDDILKSIEAGNTTLSLPNTRFVGYSSRIRGLFGLKAEAQVGALSMTAIASQEKGSSEKATIKASGEETAEFLRDWEYAENRIFDLGGVVDNLSPGDKVLDLKVFEQTNDQQDLEAFDANLYVDPTLYEVPGLVDPYQAEKLEGLRVKPMDWGTDFVWESDSSKVPHLVFLRSGAQARAVGVWMVVEHQGSSVPDTIGNIADSVYSLKLIRRDNPQPTQVTWEYMWRNCYNIPRGSNLEDLDIKIFLGSPGSENQTNSIFETQEEAGKTQKYLEIFGLDREDSQGRRIPDGRIDETQEIFRPDWGLLIFPRRKPFATDSTFTDSFGNTTYVLNPQVDTIYTSSRTNNTAPQQESQYFIRMSSRTRSDVIRLPRPNIIESSVRLVLNGKELKEGQDYRVDYNFGQITLMSTEAQDPNADLEVDYEYAPFLALQKKTLLGARAEYELNKNVSFGGTILYKSDKAQDRKPRVGQETAKMVVYDLDASVKFSPDFLTSAVDALPLIETEAPSHFTLSGEVAQSHPNPNVEGVAYVDDFESALDRVSLGTSRVLWQKSSAPLQTDNSWERGKLLWHTPLHVVNVSDVYSRDVGAGESTMRTFRLVFKPKHERTEYKDWITSGVDTTGVQLDTTANELASWAGIQRYFGSRIDAGRVQALELRIRGSSGLARGLGRGKLHFDFGVISNDIDGDNITDTEDLNGNGAVTEEEDVGLDGVPNSLEPFYHPIFNPDPDGDNWYFQDSGLCPLPPAECGLISWDEDDPRRYEWLNGTEGNRRDISVLGRPDQEKVSTSSWEQNNYYFSFAVDLATDSFLVPGSEMPIAASNVDNPWRTYRIPILEPDALEWTPGGDSVWKDDAETPDPSWSNINTVRVWFEAAPDQIENDTIEIADWHFVQMNWADTVVRSPLSDRIPEDEQTKFTVSSVSGEDRTFSPPTDVEAYEDPNTKVTETQRGLQLEYANLNRFDTCLATKTLIQVEKYSGYRRMEMYVHGDEDADLTGIRFFFRIGKDSLNYYQYATNLAPGWNRQNYVNFDFNEVTGVKDSLIRDAAEKGEREIDGTSGPYRVVGYPNLNEVRYFAAGVVNTDPTDSTSGPSGKIWLDELRVTEVRKDVGTAGRFSVNGNLADLITYNFNLSSEDPFFRSVSGATRGGGDNNLGSGNHSTSYNYNVSMNVDRFLPRSWGASLPVSYSYSKSTTTPLLRSNSDIVLPEEIRKEEQSVSENQSITVSEAFRYKGKNLLFNAFLKRQSVNVSYRRTTARSVNTPYSLGENFNLRSSLDLGISKPPTLPIFFWTKPIPLFKKVAQSSLGLYPSTWTLSADFTRNVQISDDKTLNRRTSTKRDLSGRMNVTYNMFDKLSVTYSYDTRRDLSDLNKVNWSLSDLRLGEETRFAQTFKVGYDPNLFSFLTGQWSYSANYSDDWDRATESRRSQLNRSWGVSGKFDHMALLGGQLGVRGRAGRSNVRGGGQKKETSRPLYDYPASVLRFMTGWIKAPTYSYSTGFKASIPGMIQRPSLKYRFGLTETADVDLVEQSRSAASSEDIKYSGSSGFTLLGGLSTDVKFSRSVTRDLVKQGSRSENVSTSWPDLTIRIGKFRSLPLISKYVNRLIEIFQPRTSYSRSTREVKDLDNGFVTSKTTSVNYNPLLEFNLKLFSKLGLQGRYTLSEDENRSFNQTTGEPEKLTVSTKTSMSFSTNYSFSAPGGLGIPLLGKLKFESTMTIQASVKINTSKTETSSRGGPFAPTTDKSDFTTSLSLKYTFSRQINGGLSTRWQDSNDNYRDQKSHVREVQLWVELKF
ncbi:MAG: cell surface protein SprA [bacterium]